MNKLYDLRCQGYVEINEDIWLPNLNFNALIKLRKGSGRIQIMDKFPHYDVLCGWLYASVCYVAEKLIFVPLNSDEVVSYNLKTKEFISAALNKKHVGESKGYFASAYVYGRYVYMFPVRAKCIVKYDVDRNKIYYLTDSLNTMANTSMEAAPYFYQEFEIVDEKIYMPFLEINAVGIFDVKNESMDIKYLDIVGGCSTISFIRGYFYLSSTKTKKIYRWEARTGEIQVYDIFPEDFAKGKEDYLFMGGCELADSLVLFPAFGNMIISFDPNTGKISKVQKIEDSGQLCTYFVSREKQHVLMESIGGISSFRDESSKLELHSYCHLDHQHNKRAINAFLRKYICQDSYIEGRIELAHYIEIVAEDDQSAARGEKSKCGKTIFFRTRR